MELKIRNMEKNDIISIYNLFKSQGWDKPINILENYFNEQKNNKRKVFIGVIDNEIVGYATLLPNDENGAFKNKNIPIISDFNVFIKYQNKGIGNKILDFIENEVKNYSKEICLGVGLHNGYGKAQRLYFKRGYIPDGSGVWYKDEILKPYTSCINDDELILYLSKKL